MGVIAKMHAETDLLPLSALQHLLFCPRQAALIHVEQLWAENRLTVEGMNLHRRAHEATDELRGDTRIVRGLSLRSLQYGLIGKSDIVEFTPADVARVGQLRSTPMPQLFAAIREEPTAWLVTPVEYKRGKPKSDDSDRVQLCAQAICLEEMLAVKIDEGALFYGQRRRRMSVPFDVSLRTANDNSNRRTVSCSLFCRKDSARSL
ncbi:CRISPR-associated protein Cas4 [Blastopirellula sp. J2-11]|uniref:CRISPR-associated protein Cas4 n=1 Tax=Blastopirellula sp. J2-11 TaxID=2943192 RepID=UPI0021C8660C|nr:CRISPR-associated protein Cas4 [Blastopirellula sp. J2-11]UUO04509.1 CRISPR-associated protein Cas4 [Blastopirellula sp. J2-11]